MGLVQVAAVYLVEKMLEVIVIRNRGVSEIVVGFKSDKEFNEDYNMGDVEVVIEELLEVLEVKRYKCEILGVIENLLF